MLNYSIVGDGLFLVTGVVQTIRSKQLMLGKMSGSQAWLKRNQIRSEPEYSNAGTHLFLNQKTF